jgi:hypothetical protein
MVCSRNRSSQDNTQGSPESFTGIRFHIIQMDRTTLSMQNGSRTSAERMLTPGQRALLSRKLHTQPGALAHSGGDVQEQLSSLWQAAIALVLQLDGLPEEALHWWAAHPAGHILLTAHHSGYCEGTLVEDERELTSVSRIPLQQIVFHIEQAAIAALFPLDHLLGCNGAPHEPWLSDGGGLTLYWQRVGQQIARLHTLGYGLSEPARQDVHIYLAEGLYLALNDRRRLNMNDPKLERLLKSSLLSTSFWRNFQ